MKEKATGSTLHFLNEGVDDGGSALRFLNDGKRQVVLLITFSMKEMVNGTLHFLNEGMDGGGSALHFLHEGTGGGFCSSLPQ